MSEQDIGMSHADGLSKAKRFAGREWSGNKEQQANLINSVANQVRLKEGESSANEVVKEVSRTMKTQDWNDNPKARPGGFVVSVCLKECMNRGNLCEDCFKWSHFEPLTKE